LRDEDGFVRAAARGTLFLDEIGDLPPAAQGTLLRVLQEGEVVPVGSSRAVRVDVRFVSATHADLDALVERGAFRRDLYARLAGFVHALPPLRARREDFGVLMASVLERAGAAKLAFTAEAGAALLRHSWPMNIRELAQSVASSAILAGDGAVGLAHLPAARRSIPSTDHALATPLDENEDDVRRALVDALARHGGNVSEVAREMGKARMQVQRWMKRWGLERETFKR
jgi:transcriptional regulator of acetoin/glycerol metabolism